MDEHVPRAVTNGLRLRGVSVLTAQEDGRGGASDRDLLSRATELGRVLFSQDVDLLGEASQRQKAGLRFPGLVFAPQLDVSIGQCVADLELVATALSPDELADLVLFLPL